MAADSKVEPQFHLGTAHILFLDVVGYSKLVVNEQREVVQQLTEIVRNTPQFCKSDTNGKLIRIPIGDGFSGGLWPPTACPNVCNSRVQASNCRSCDPAHTERRYRRKSLYHACWIAEPFEPHLSG